MYQDNRVTPQSINNAQESSDLRVPSTLKSVGMNFAQTATAPIRAGFDIIAGLQGLPATNPLDDSFAVFNKAMETPNETWGQETVDFFAAGIGYLNPVNDIALVKPAMGAVSAGASAISRALPSAFTAVTRAPIRTFGGALSKYLPETIGGAAEHIAKSMAVGAAITAPEAMLDNYDKKTNTFNMWGAASQSFSNGVLAVALDSIPITAGLVFGKHKKSFGVDYENPLPGEDHKMAQFDKALDDGQLTTGEHSWIKSYLENPNDKEALKNKGTDILLKHDYPVDTSAGKVMMNLMKKGEYDNFHTGMLDQISSGASGDMASTLSDYSAASSFDYMTSQNSKLIDGLQGYVHFMEKRLEKEPDNMARFEKAVKKADLQHIEEGHPMSQTGVLKELKAVDYDLQRLPNAIPKNMRFRAKQERDIIKLKRDISRFKKLVKHDPSYEQRIDEAANKLRELKSSKQKLLSPNQELESLKSHFLGKRFLPDHYRNTHDYHRLVDLSHFSTKADALLHHIDLKDQYETQTAYKDMIKFMNDVIGSNVNKFADPNKVISYFKSRMDNVGTDVDETINRKDSRTTKEIPIEANRGSFSSVKKSDQLSDMQQDLKSEVNIDDEILQANQTDVDSAGSKDYEEQYQANKNRYQQFKASTDDLSRLVSCELGSKGEE